ncbi:hypothetical protein pipiens_011937 [Culex pipiens pipiens]|uniref:Adenylate cyclase n=1 Tax=Culex pipiens pipiens TaxID=38569 RepID=A0ABD1D4A8_CULPP
MDRIDADHEKVPLLNPVGFTPDQGRKPPSRISIEPMVFLHSLGWSLSEVRLTDQIVYQTCVFKLGSAEEVCSQLHSGDNATASMVLEQVVQPYAASVSMAIVLLTSVVPAVAALFFGPWSERFGRKPVIAIASIVGGMVEFAIAGRVLFFLYTRRQFGWDVEMYSLWLSSELAIIMFGNFFGIFLMRKLFKMSDLGLLTLSTINHLGDYLIKGSARQGWQLFLTTFMSPFKGIDGAASRSILSTILPDDEVGKTYSLDLSIKAVTPLVSVFLFTYVYNSTIESAPYAYLFLTSGVFAVNLVIITYVLQEI